MITEKAMKFEESLEQCRRDVALVGSMDDARRAELDEAVWDNCTATLAVLWRRPDILGHLDECVALYARVAELLEPIAWERRRDLLPLLADMRLDAALCVLHAGQLERGTALLERAIEPMAMLARFGDETGEGYGAAVVIARRLCGAVARGPEGRGEARELVAVLLAAGQATEEEA